MGRYGEGGFYLLIIILSGESNCSPFLRKSHILSLECQYLTQLYYEILAGHALLCLFSAIREAIHIVLVPRWYLTTDNDICHYKSKLASDYFAA